VTPLPPLLSYCVVNTNAREYLLAGLTAIEHAHPEGVEREILVLDNASEDGSAEAVRRLGGEIRLIALEQRAGKAENDSTLMRAAQGRYCLLLNEDSELRPGSVEALLEVMEREPKAAAATPQLLDSDGMPVPCAWRFPGVGTALAGALFLHRWLTVQSKGGRVRSIDWAQSSALMVRRAGAAAVDYMDPEFFVYYDECDFAKRLREDGWHSLYVPAAEAVHHDQLSTDLAKGLPRIVEFHRNRDLYFRKHGMRLTRLVWKACWIWAYLARAAAATVLPGRDPRRYLLHARQELLPGRGEGIREAADAHNRGLAQ